MAECLLRVVDKTSSDPVSNAGLTKRGHVICVQPDGWPWGTEELANPEWRIVLLPGPVEDWAHLLVPEPITDPAKASPTRARRLWRLDLDSPAVTPEIAAACAAADPIAVADLSARATTREITSVVETVIATDAGVDVSAETVPSIEARYPVDAAIVEAVDGLDCLAVTAVGPQVRPVVAFAMDAAMVDALLVRTNG